MRRQDNVALGDVVSMQQLRLAARALQRYRWRILAVLLTIAVDATFTIVFYYGMKLLIDAAVGSRDQGTMVRLVAGLGAF